MSNVLPITVAEFGRALTACRPPNGWGKRIVVAVSGGCDSLGMLWLLRELYQQARITEPQILGVTIDHDLRPQSHAEAAAVGAFCRDIGVAHQVMKIPWGTHAWPDRPQDHSTLELRARQARYWAFYQIMRESGSSAMLTAHHADDQLETAIYRGERGSKLVGMLGMRKLRRFGMGGYSRYLQFGVPGMHMWMCRPLLTFSKERLKATCVAANLPWMEDPSNSNPELTRRNAIRAKLTELRAEGDLSPWSERLKRFDMEEDVRRELAGVLDSLPPSASVSELAEHMLKVYEEYEAAVKEYLSAATKIDPGAPMVIVDTTKPPPSEHIAFGVILRILRYVSPRPWGDLSAEARRRTDSLERISTMLWGRKPSPVDNQYHAAPFSAGGGVLWTPHERISSGNQTPWMAMREPPSRGQAGLMFYHLSKHILEAVTKGRPAQPILWDNRYEITLPSEFPPEMLQALEERQGRVVLGPHSKYFLPLVNFEHRGKNKVVAALTPDGQVRSFMKPEGWQFEWVRPLH